MFPNSNEVHAWRFISMGSVPCEDVFSMCLLYFSSKSRHLTRGVCVGLDTLAFTLKFLEQSWNSPIDDMSTTVPKVAM